MSITTNFTWTNNTARSTSDIATLAVDTGTNYGYKGALTANGSCTMSNNTCELEAPELVTLESHDIVGKYKTRIQSAYPPAFAKAMQIGVKTDSMLTSRDATNSDYHLDQVIQCDVTLRFEKTNIVTAAMLEEVLKRAVSYYYDESGNCRISNLMRGCTQLK